MDLCLHAVVVFAAVAISVVLAAVAIKVDAIILFCLFYAFSYEKTAIK